MKSIEEKAKIAYQIEVTENGCNAGETFAISMYNRGIFDAQQWISVEDEFPEEYKQSGYSKQVICKTTMGSFVVLHYDMEYNRFTAPAHVEVTHWRPIEFK